MDYKTEKIVTVQRRDTSVPVGKGSARAGSPRPSSNDCSEHMVDTQAGVLDIATGEKTRKDIGSGGNKPTKLTENQTKADKTEESNPFGRRGLARTPPRDRIHSCPGILLREDKEEGRLSKPELDMQRWEREEKTAFESLGKNITIIESIVKEARNIHKPIRDAIVAAVINYQRMREVREAQTKLKEQKIQEMKPESRVPVKDVAVQTNPERHSSVAADDNKSKKRTASSPPETPAEKRKVRAKKTLVQGEETRRPSETDEMQERKENDPEWKTVQHRKTKRKKDDDQVSRPRRKLPEAVAVKPKGDSQSYAEILKNIKTKVDPTALGVKVSKIRQTRRGELLIEIVKDSGKIEDLKCAVAQALGDDASVRNMSRDVTIEIKDIDGATEADEVVNAIRLAVPETDFERIKVRALIKTYGETQVAVITLPSSTAEVVLKAGRLKIGWIMCRVRERRRAERCFRCFGFGHVARDCKGPDRSKLCRLCCKEGHIARNCTENPFCEACYDKDKPGGAQHILGSVKCRSYRRETQQTHAQR